MNRAVYDALSAVKDAELAGPVFRQASGAAWGSIRTAFARAVESAKTRYGRTQSRKYPPELAGARRAQALVEQELAIPLREVVDVSRGGEAERGVHPDRDRVRLLRRREEAGGRRGLFCPPGEGPPGAPRAGGCRRAPRAR